MSDFKVKMLQNQFRSPRGSLQHSPDLLAVIKRTYFYGYGRLQEGQEGGRGRRGRDPVCIIKFSLSRGSMLK